MLIPDKHIYDQPPVSTLKTSCKKGKPILLNSNMLPELPDDYIRPGPRCVICTVPFENKEQVALGIMLSTLFHRLFLIIQQYSAVMKTIMSGLQSLDFLLLDHLRNVL